MRKTVVFDFDGVIHSYRTPWEREDIIPDPPTDGIRRLLYYVKHNLESDIVIVSSRSASYEGRKAIWEWLRHYKIDKFIDDVRAEKPPACCYVDDRAVLFEKDNMVNVLYKIKDFVKGE